MKFETPLELPPKQLKEKQPEIWELAQGLVQYMRTDILKQVRDKIKPALPVELHGDLYHLYQKHLHKNKLHRSNI